MKTKNVIQFRDFLKPYKKAYISSIALAVIGVFFGLVPYYIAYHLLVNIQTPLSYREIFLAAVFMLMAFILQLAMHNASTAISHKTAFRILEQMRIAITDKMLRMPMGYMQVQGAGHFHHILIDGTERLEYPLAHAIPEISSNVLIPAGIIGLLFVVDWRMALSVLVPATLTLLFYLPM